MYTQIDPDPRRRIEGRSQFVPKAMATRPGVDIAEIREAVRAGQAAERAEYARKLAIVDQFAAAFRNRVATGTRTGRCSADGRAELRRALDRLFIDELTNF